eukprot:9015980-Prorocentrum_lima.AAC.1
MTSSLVGSEMCIRDRDKTVAERQPPTQRGKHKPARGGGNLAGNGRATCCLLYTSDAADDM